MNPNGQIELGQFGRWFSVCKHCDRQSDEWQYEADLQAWEDDHVATRNHPWNTQFLRLGYPPKEHVHVHGGRGSWYEGNCHACHGEIKVGDTIAHRRPGWVCRDCALKLQAGAA